MSLQHGSKTHAPKETDVKAISQTIIGCEQTHYNSLIKAIIRNNKIKKTIKTN